MSKQQCRWCGHQYETDSLWDDGFCCGAHRAYARKNKIYGKTPRGCVYLLILFCLAFFGLSLYFNNNKDAYKGHKSRVEKVSHKSKRSKKHRRERHKRRGQERTYKMERIGTEGGAGETETNAPVGESSPSTSSDAQLNAEN